MTRLAFSRGGVGQDFLEAAGGKVGDGRGAARIAQHALRGHDDERFTDLRPQRLAAQQVEVAGRGRGIGDLDVVLGAGLEIALQPGTGVFRALAVIAVGQEQDDAGGLAPLGFGANDVLSMMICAPLAKSPNWASQRTSMSGKSRRSRSRSRGRRTQRAGCYRRRIWPGPGGCC